MEAEVTRRSRWVVRAYCYHCLADRKHDIWPQDEVYEPDGTWRQALQCQVCDRILLRPK